MSGISRPALLAALVIAQLATVFALASVSGQVTGDAQTRLNDALIETTAAETVEQVRSHVEPVQAIVAVAASLAADPDIESDELQGAFVAALERTPQLAGVFVGQPDGAFFDVRQTEEGLRVKTITTAEERSVLLQFLDDSGAVIDERLDPDDEYDPRARPWYLSAADEPNAAVWTDPYIFFTSQQPGITIAESITVNGQTVAVIGADIELGSISGFLAELNASQFGGVTLRDERGNLLASSSGIVDGNVTADFQADFGEPQARDLDVDNTTWTVEVFLDDDAATADLTAASERERVLTVIIGLIAVGIIAVLAAFVLRPIDTLVEQATIDPLTQLPNRRVSLNVAEESLNNNSPSGLVMIDVDHFKSINDDNSHQVGDEVLTEVARRMAAVVESYGGTIGRIGGEEFLAVFDGVAAQRAKTATSELLKGIRSKPIHSTAGRIDVTLSAGVVLTDTAVPLARMMSRADAALAKAKADGRDRAVIETALGLTELTAAAASK